MYMMMWVLSTITRSHNPKELPDDCQALDEREERNGSSLRIKIGLTQTLYKSYFLSGRIDETSILRNIRDHFSVGMKNIIVVLLMLLLLPP
jgi:hypothetical protein